MAQAKNPPWLMWGSTQVVQLDAAGSPAINNQQLAAIAYGRPESWNFFFAAQLVNVSGPPAANVNFHVGFDITPGVGRSSFPTQNDTVLLTPFQDLSFCTMNFLLPAGTTPVGNIVSKRWTSTVRSPLLDDADPTSRLVIDHFVAEDLQCNARITQATAGANIGATFLLTAFFAPRTHVRPDWYSAGSLGSKER